MQLESFSAKSANKEEVLSSVENQETLPLKTERLLSNYITKLEKVDSLKDKTDLSSFLIELKDIQALFEDDPNEELALTKDQQLYSFYHGLSLLQKQYAVELSSGLEKIKEDIKREYHSFTDLDIEQIEDLDELERNAKEGAKAGNEHAFKEWQELKMKREKFQRKILQTKSHQVALAEKISAFFEKKGREIDTFFLETKILNFLGEKQFGNKLGKVATIGIVTSIAIFKAMPAEAFQADQQTIEVPEEEVPEEKNHKQSLHQNPEPSLSEKDDSQEKLDLEKNSKEDLQEHPKSHELTTENEIHDIKDAIKFFQQKLEPIENQENTQIEMKAATEMTLELIGNDPKKANLLIENSEAVFESIQEEIANIIITLACTQADADVVVSHIIELTYSLDLEGLKQIIEYFYKENPSTLELMIEKITEKSEQRGFSLMLDAMQETVPIQMQTILLEKAINKDPFFVSVTLSPNYKNGSARQKTEEFLSRLEPRVKELLTRSDELAKEELELKNLPGELIMADHFPLDKEKFQKSMLSFEKVIKFQNSYTENSWQFSEYAHKLVNIPQEAFDKIFFSENFQELLKSKSGEMSYMNAFSLAQAVYRNLEKNELPLSPESIDSMAKEVLEYIDATKNTEIFGKDTKLILFTHAEHKYSNEKILADLFYKAGGKEENILVNVKGMAMVEGHNLFKEQVLEAIRHNKGAVTILFNGHGSQEVWSFDKNQITDLVSSTENNPSGLNYKELGDALAESGNIENVRIVGATCLAYDFIQNLYSYLENEKGIKEKPLVTITEANKGKAGKSTINSKGIKDFLLRTLSEEITKDEPVTVNTFLKAEDKGWFKQDPAILLGKSVDLSHENPNYSSSQKEVPKPTKNFIEVGQNKIDEEKIDMA